MADEGERLARARALSSPLRLRILRICLHEPRTNKEIADILGVTPATCLHHVRTLAAADFLEPLEPRRGRRGAKEIPYRATGLSWSTPLEPEQASLLLDTFLSEIEGMPPGALKMSRLGLKLNPADLAEFHERLDGLFDEFKDRGPDPDGTPISIFYAEHPDPQSN